MFFITLLYSREELCQLNTILRIKIEVENTYLKWQNPSSNTVLNYYSAMKHNEIVIIFIKQSLLNKLPFICFNNGMQQGMKLYEKNRKNKHIVY